MRKMKRDFAVGLVAQYPREYYLGDGLLYRDGKAIARVSQADLDADCLLNPYVPIQLGGFNCAGEYRMPRPFLRKAMDDMAREMWGGRLVDNIVQSRAAGVDFAGLPTVTHDRDTGIEYRRDEEGRLVSMTMTVAIVGAKYHKGAPAALSEMDRLLAKESIAFQQGVELRRESDNKHDKNAVAVWVRYRKGGHTHEQHLGYVPREDAKAVAKVMDNGIRIKATYKGSSEMTLWWPASNKEDLEREYRRAMSEGEGL